METRRDLKPDFRLPLKALFVEFARLLDFLALEGLVLLLGAPGGLEVHQGRRYVFPVRALDAVETHPVSAHFVALRDLIRAVLEKELDVGPSHAGLGQHTTKAQRNQEERDSAAQPHHAQNPRRIRCYRGSERHSMRERWARALTPMEVARVGARVVVGSPAS